MNLSAFVSDLLDPMQLLTHLPYALLVLSMLMNDMGWLRAIAIAAGVIRIINRAFIVVDPVIVFWEILFVSVNVGQLAILWYYRKRHRFSADEARFLETMPSDIERRTLRKILSLGAMRTIEAGETLLVEKQPATQVFFISDGVAQVEKEGRIIAVCGPGDYLGEMSFITGEPASATVRAAKALRVLAFDQIRLRRAADADGELQRALQGGFNRNLIGKLSRTGANVG